MPRHSLLATLHNHAYKALIGKAKQAADELPVLGTKQVPKGGRQHDSSQQQGDHGIIYR